jgi:hypothetical protein
MIGLGGGWPELKKEGLRPVLTEEDDQGKEIAVHFRSLTRIPCLNILASFRLLEGTAVAITDYNTFKYGLQVYETALKDAKISPPEFNFNPPIIYWSELKIHKNNNEEFCQKLVEKCPFVRFDRTSHCITIYPSDEYIIVTDIAPHNCGFSLGFFNCPEHFIFNDKIDRDPSIDELRVARHEYRKEYTFNLLQSKADRKESKIPWAYASDYCYSQFLTKFEDRVAELEKNEK